MKIKVEGPLSFFTCKTGTGKVRYCVRVTGIARDEKGETVKVSPEHDGYITVQSFADWDGMLPESLKAVSRETTYEDPETGLLRSVKGLLEGAIEFSGDLPVQVVAGRTRQFHQVTLPDPAAFVAKKTGLKLVRF